MIVTAAVIFTITLHSILVGKTPPNKDFLEEKKKTTILMSVRRYTSFFLTIIFLSIRQIYLFINKIIFLLNKILYNVSTKN